MIIHHAEPCISCEHYSSDTREINHWVCDFDHDTCPHIEVLHKAVGYKERIDAGVLDKIREEIKSKKFGLTDTEDGRRIQSDIHAGFDGGIECALQIIDKYKASPTRA